MTTTTRAPAPKYAVLSVERGEVCMVSRYYRRKHEAQAWLNYLLEEWSPLPEGFYLQTVRVCTMSDYAASAR